MNTINRQRFLAELSKLLTFMYEEDRQRALSMYERMFDITEDEQGLIQHLMSPTRQAVIIARAYDAKERKLSVSTQVRGDTDETEGSEIPKFVLAINKIFDDLFPDSAEDALEKDQVSFFDLGLAQKEDFTAPKPAVPAGAVLLSDTQKFRLDPQAAEAGDANEAETTAADEAPDADFVPADETVSVEPDSTDETQDVFAGGATIDELITAWKKDLEADMGGTAETAADPDAAADVPAAAEELPAQETEEEISSEELPASSAEDAPAPEEAPVEEAAEEAPEDAEVPETDGAESEAAAETDIPVEDSGEADAVEEAAPVPEAPLPAGSRKSAAAPQEASVPKTVLFLLVAIPVVLVLLALLLIPTLLFVGVSAGLIILGATLAVSGAPLVVSAFSGSSALADPLLLIGAALVALALGLLFLWLTVWTIGGGMGGVIRTVGELRRKLCMKKEGTEE